MVDTTHLSALELRLSNERIALRKAMTKNERTLRQVWIAQIEKEIAQEKAFLGLNTETLESMSDDELLAELIGR